MLKDNVSKQALNQRLRKWARKLKNQVVVMYFVMKHPDTPLFVKVCAAIIVGYALSPIDLIPDFVPVLGYLDDMILLPLGIMFVMKLVPVHIIEECRIKAESTLAFSKPKIWIAAVIIVLIWMFILYSLFIWLNMHWFQY